MNIHYIPEPVAIFGAVFTPKSHYKIPTTGNYGKYNAILSQSKSLVLFIERRTLSGLVSGCWSLRRRPDGRLSK